MSYFFCKITTLYLSYVVPVKSTVEISQNFVAFSDYVNFTRPEIGNPLGKVGYYPGLSENGSVRGSIAPLPYLDFGWNRSKTLSFKRPVITT